MCDTVLIHCFMMELPYKYNTNSCNVFCSWIAWQAAVLCNLKWGDCGKREKRGSTIVAVRWLLWQWAHPTLLLALPGSLGLDMGSGLALGNIPGMSSSCCRTQLTAHFRGSFRNAVISLPSVCHFFLLFHLLHQGQAADGTEFSKSWDGYIRPQWP